MASAKTYDQIAWTSLGSAAATVSLSSIPSTYTDLKLIINITPSVSTATINIRFNTDSATNYSFRYLAGNGTAASSGSTQSFASIKLGAGLVNPSTSYPYIRDVDIFNYASTSTYKTILSKAATDINGSGETSVIVGLWRSTAAITSIDLTSNGNGNWAAGSTFALYGIKAA